ncbi:MAG: hypothetical protein LBB74_03615 [Chitinispirillales bacterium]|jgi:hypothetical protein|nr:hypothetical protein [Chitinispirillales bacterium]
MQKGWFRHFMSGFVSAFDITGGSFRHRSDYANGFERDREALAGDWRRVGDSLRWAMNQIDREAANGRRE